MLTRQRALLGQHNPTLSALQAENQQLRQALRDQQAVVANLSPPSLSTASAQPQPVFSPLNPRITDPEHFNGTQARFSQFLLQCLYVFTLRPHPTDKHTKFCTLNQLLWFRVVVWAQVVWAQAGDSSHPPASRSLGGFLHNFKSVFYLPDFEGDVTQLLLQVSQGGASVAGCFIQHHLHLCRWIFEPHPEGCTLYDLAEEPEEHQPSHRFN